MLFPEQGHLPRLRKNKSYPSQSHRWTLCDPATWQSNEPTRCNKLNATKKLIYTEARLAAAQKEHDEIVAWHKQIETELQEIKDEKDQLWNKPSDSDTEEALEGDEGLDNDWEAMSTEVSYDTDCLSGESVAQFEKFFKNASCLAENRQISQDRSASHEVQ